MAAPATTNGNNRPPATTPGASARQEIETRIAIETGDSASRYWLHLEWMSHGYYPAAETANEITQMTATCTEACFSAAANAVRLRPARAVRRVLRIKRAPITATTVSGIPCHENRFRAARVGHSPIGLPASTVWRT